MKEQTTGYAEALALLEIAPPWRWQEDAGTLLEAVLGDETARPEDRLLAARLAGDHSGIGDTLARCLLDVGCRKSEATELRGAAIVALGPALEIFDTHGLDEPDMASISELTFAAIGKALRNRYEDEEEADEVRRAALGTSVRAPRDWHGAAIREAFAREEVEWRVVAVWCMCFVGGFAEEILRALDSEDEDLLYNAVCAAGAHPVKGAFAIVAALAESPATSVPLRLAAIEALGVYPCDEAWELLASLVGAANEEVAAAAQEALVMLEGVASLGAGDCADEAEP